MRKDKRSQKPLNISVQKKRVLFKRITSHEFVSPKNILTKSDLKKFRWNKEISHQVIAKRISNKKIYNKFEPLWFASSTQGVPLRESIEASYLVAEQIEKLSKKRDLLGLNRFLVNISQRASIELCNFYKLEKQDTEIFFDDNATLAVYHFLNIIRLPNIVHLVTSVDIGQTLRQVLTGEKEEKIMFSFRPAFDIWENKIYLENYKKVGPFFSHVINTFDHNKYQSDEIFLTEIKTVTERFSPFIYIIPTVTSSGRKLPFQEASHYIRSVSNAKYNPIIIIDDAQGIGRLNPSEYRQEGVATSILTHADAILTTGTKALGGLTGTAAVLIKKSRFKSLYKHKDQKGIIFRSRKHNLVSTDHKLVKLHNQHSDHVINAPEISSLIIALQNIKFSKNTEEAMTSAQKLVKDMLKSIPGVTVLQSENGNSSSVNSIVTFYLKDLPKMAESFRKYIIEDECLLSQKSSPITIPKIIVTDKIDYLRVALDPHKIKQVRYRRSLTETTKRICDALIFFQEKNQRDNQIN